MVCIFDCETIPDIELVKQEFKVGLNNELDELEICERAFEIQKERVGNSFLPIPFHRVVAISSVIADENLNFLKVGSLPKESESEEEILREFLNFIDKKKPKLVSFNGNGFDLPMLFLRAMKYNLSCKSYFSSDKWEGYRSRYSEKKNLDLLDSIANFGAVRGLKLDTISSMLGSPGKFDVSGSEVHKLYFNQELNKIIEYCESDVLNTYILLLKYEIVKGNITLSHYQNIIKSFLEKLPKERSYSEIFQKYIESEIC